MRKNLHKRNNNHKCSFERTGYGAALKVTSNTISKVCLHKAKVNFPWHGQKAKTKWV